MTGASCGISKLLTWPQLDAEYRGIELLISFFQNIMMMMMMMMMMMNDAITITQQSRSEGVWQRGLS